MSAADHTITGPDHAGWLAVFVLLRELYHRPATSSLFDVTAIVRHRLAELWRIEMHDENIHSIVATLIDKQWIVRADTQRPTLGLSELGQEYRRIMESDWRARSAADVPAQLQLDDPAA